MKELESETQEICMCKPELKSSSPRSISIGQLNTLLHLHPQSINHVCLRVVLLD